MRPLSGYVHCWTQLPVSHILLCLPLRVKWLKHRHHRNRGPYRSQKLCAPAFVLFELSFEKQRIKLKLKAGKRRLKYFSFYQINEKIGMAKIKSAFLFIYW